MDEDKAARIFVKFFGDLCNSHGQLQTWLAENNPSAASDAEGGSPASHAAFEQLQQINDEEGQVIEAIRILKASIKHYAVSAAAPRNVVRI